jgi:hypothetical protein
MSTLGEPCHDDALAAGGDGAGGARVSGVFREACERNGGECPDGKKHRQRLGGEATHSGTRLRARKGDTGMAASASSAVFSSTSFTMPVMMSLSWKSFGV